MDFKEILCFAQDDVNQFSEFDVSDTYLLEKHSSLPLDTLLTPGCQLESASSEQFAYFTESNCYNQDRKASNRMAAKRYRMKQKNTVCQLNNKVNELKHYNKALEQHLEKNKKRIEDLENKIRLMKEAR